MKKTYVLVFILGITAPFYGFTDDIQTKHDEIRLKHQIDVDHLQQWLTPLQEQESETSENKNDQNILSKAAYSILARLRAYLDEIQDEFNGDFYIDISDIDDDLDEEHRDHMQSETK